MLLKNKVAAVYGAGAIGWLVLGRSFDISFDVPKRRGRQVVVSLRRGIPEWYPNASPAYRSPCYWQD
jgi:hypothetical protein